MNLAHAMGMQLGGGQSSQIMAFLPLILLFAVFYFLLIRPQQKRARTHKTFIENLKKGDKIVTSGGMYGTITGVTDDSVTLEVAEKVRIRVLKSAVADYAKGD